ncbi:MAG: ribulose-phosphate 3-epimerase [Phycisphaerales bacterium]|nr:ribulose-phosphate 3-epimerase [Phycisphaerales bacterium]
MIIDPFTTRDRLITASILSADFSKLGSEIDDVLAGGADFLHLDVLDAHFAPNLSFGPPVIRCIRPVTRAFFDAHLMIAEPLRWAPAMVKAGAQNITFHVEVADDPARFAREIRQLGCRVGIALSPSTPVQAILPALDEVDVVLVMSVVPGFSGQVFMPEVLGKCQEIKKRLRENQRMEIDGGINEQTIASAVAAGVDWFVTASAVFDEPDRRAALAKLRQHLPGRSDS